MRKVRSDVVVVGGGPAGSTASTLLAKAGYSVVQLERQHHPRHQIGESLLPATVHGICRLLDVFDEVAAAGFVRKRGGTVRWGREAEPFTFAFQSTTLAGADYAFQVERSRFDSILFENAQRHGVDTREGVQAHSLVWEAGRAAGVTVSDDQGAEFTIEADYVVDASGHAGRLARAIRKKVYSRFFQNVAVYGYFRGADRCPPPDDGNVVTSAFDQGWCWFIPLSDELTSVGAVVDRRHASQIGADRESALREFVSACPIVCDLLAPAARVTEGTYGEVRVRKDWSFMSDKLTAPGIALAGDAACFIDPVFSSGVHLATYGGLLAARTAATVLAGELDESRCQAEFEGRYRREFRVWYEFLVAFFDMQQGWDDYFWSARNVLNTDERRNEAFINLVAGAGTTADEFFTGRQDLGHEFASMVEVLGERSRDTPAPPAAGAATRLNDERVRESRALIAGNSELPLLDGGLVASADSLRWCLPPERRPGDRVLA